MGISGTANAAVTNDGNELLTQCQHFINAVEDKKFDEFKAGVCVGTIKGVDTTVWFLSDDLRKTAQFCTPRDVTNGQLVRIVVKWLKDHPKALHENRTGLIWLALKDAFPCKG